MENVKEIDATHYVWQEAEEVERAEREAAEGLHDRDDTEPPAAPAGSGIIPVYYPTPAWVVDALIENARLPAGLYVEPCAGEGKIVRALTRRVPWLFRGLLANEVQARFFYSLAGALDDAPGSFQRKYSQHDFFDDGFAREVWRCQDNIDPAGKLPLVCVTNPPFEQALDWVQRALGLFDVVAMLLPLTFLESRVRNPFHLAAPCSVYVIPNRIDFVGQSSGARLANAWFVWGLPPDPGGSRLKVLPWQLDEVTNADRDSRSFEQLNPHLKA